MMARVGGAWPCLAAVVLLGGCRGEGLPDGIPPLQAARVTVFQQGSPVPGATVIFQPQGDGEWHASGTAGPDGVAVMRTMGKYPGVAAGQYAVKITKTEAYETGKTELDDDGNSVPALNTKNLLPAKYASFATSDLKVTVSEGPNDVEFDLTQ